MEETEETKYITTDLSRGCHTTERVENATMMSKQSFDTITQD